MRDPKSVEKVESLHPSIRNEVKLKIEEAEKLLGEDIAVRVTQGLRTIEYQNELYNQPWDKKDNDKDGKIDEKDEKVTSAKGGSSYHNFGLAFDFCLLFKDKATGKYMFEERRSWQVGAYWMKVVQVFKAAGYKWGGDWSAAKRDYPHFEKSPIYWKNLLRKYNNKEFIPGTKYVKL